MRGFLLQKANELNKRKEEEQISNSRDRKNLEEEWGKKAGKTETRVGIKTTKGKILEGARRFKELEERVREIQLEEKKCEHDFEIKQLKEEVRSGKQIKESLERKIKREEEHLEERTEELLGKSRRFEKLQEEIRENLEEADRKQKRYER